MVVWSNRKYNLPFQMVCCTEPSGEARPETVWKKGRHPEKIFGRWLDEPSVHHHLSQANFIRSDQRCESASSVEPVGESNSYQEETKPSFPSRQVISAVLCSPFLKKNDVTQGIAGKRLEEPPLLYSNQQSYLNHTCSRQSVSKEVWLVWTVLCSATSTE